MKISYYTELFSHFLSVNQMISKIAELNYIRKFEYFHIYGTFGVLRGFAALALPNTPFC